jgi:integrase
MASPVYDKRRNTWSVRFRWPRGRQGVQRTFNCESEREAKSKTENIDKLIAKLTDNSLPFSIPSTVEDEPLWIFSGGTKGFKQTPQSAKPTTIRELVDAYLTFRKSQADSGDLSVAMYTDDYYQLEAFADHCKKNGKTSLAEVVTPDFLNKHKADTRDKYSVTTLWHSVKAVKRLLTWGWKQERLESLPRNLDDYAKVERPKPAPKFFMVEEVKSMYASATDRMRLYILLALNGGLTQIDIATLTHNMVDWKIGIISRDRNKTGVPQGCKLWPTTLALLKQAATNSNAKGNNLVLVSEEGNQLTYETVSIDGKHSKVDSIRSAFGRLKIKCKLKDNRGFKTFRKTGADAIAKQYQSETHLVDLYLAHSVNGMRKHYANQYFDELYKATDWLAGQYGFDKIQTPTAEKKNAKGRGAKK